MPNEEEVKPAEVEKGKSRTRATFPRIALDKILELPRAIYELGEGDPVPRLVVFDKLGKSPDSGPSRMLITTSNAYGLTTGSYQAERLGITDKGRAIIKPKSDAERAKVVAQLLMSNDLFEQFHTKYKSRALPAEPIAIDFLKQAGGLSDADAKAAYEVFVENLKSQGFTKELSGRQTILPLEMISPAGDENHEDSTEEPVSERASVGSQSVNDTPDSEVAGGKLVPKAKGSLAPQFNFNIQIQLPDGATTETYDAIFKSMAEHLLKPYGE